MWTVFIGDMIQDHDLSRVRSVELGGSDICEACTSCSVPTNQKIREFDELKTSLRKEFAEEIKLLFAQSKNLITQALKPTSRENPEVNHYDQKLTPASALASPPKEIGNWQTTFFYAVL